MEISIKIESFEDLNANLANLSNVYRFLDHTSQIKVDTLVFNYIMELLKGTRISCEHFCKILQNEYHCYEPMNWLNSSFEYIEFLNNLACSIRDRFYCDNFMGLEGTPEKFQPLTRRYIVELLLCIYYEEYD